MTKWLPKDDQNRKVTYPFLRPSLFGTVHVSTKTRPSHRLELYILLLRDSRDVSDSRDPFSETTTSVGRAALEVSRGPCYQRDPLNVCYSARLEKGWNCRFQNLPCREGWVKVQGSVAQGLRQVAFPGGRNHRIQTSARFGKVFLYLP